jgi:hypothetical protein
MATEQVSQIGGGVIHKYTTTGSAAMSDTTGALDQAAAFKSFTIHLDAAGQQGDTLTITLDHRTGADYDAVLYSGDMGGITSRVLDENDFNVTPRRGDAIIWAWENTGQATYGAEMTLIEEGAL